MVETSFSWTLVDGNNDWSRGKRSTMAKRQGMVVMRASGKTKREKGEKSPSARSLSQTLNRRSSLHRSAPAAVAVSLSHTRRTSVSSLNPPLRHPLAPTVSHVQHSQRRGFVSKLLDIWFCSAAAVVVLSCCYVVLNCYCFACSVLLVFLHHISSYCSKNYSEVFLDFAPSSVSKLNEKDNYTRKHCQLIVVRAYMLPLMHVWCLVLLFQLFSLFFNFYGNSCPVIDVVVRNVGLMTNALVQSCAESIQRLLESRWEAEKTVKICEEGGIIIKEGERARVLAILWKENSAKNYEKKQKQTSKKEVGQSVYERKKSLRSDSIRKVIFQIWCTNKIPDAALPEGEDHEDRLRNTTSTRGSPCQVVVELTPASYLKHSLSSVKPSDRSGALLSASLVASGVVSDRFRLGSARVPSATSCVLVGLFEMIDSWYCEPSGKRSVVVQSSLPVTSSRPN
ncbi:hypothetical protein AHAS_Ahas13G0264500 [Arachis hypogaea]